MKFREFVSWCNERSCDGCWSMLTAITCIEIINDVRSKPFWKREKYWQSINKEYRVEELIVNVIDRKIDEVYGS